MPTGAPARDAYQGQQGDSGARCHQRTWLYSDAFREGAAAEAFGFWARLSVAISFSSFATRFSRSSMPRTFLPSSSTRPRRSLTAPSAFTAPGRSASLASVCSPRPARRPIASPPSFEVFLASFITQSYHAFGNDGAARVYCGAVEGFRSAYDIRVRFAETDAQGIAHHASFVVWLEVARVAYLADHANGYRALREQGIEALTTGVRVDYLATALFDDVLTIRLQCCDIQGARFRYEYRVEREGQLIATAETLHATVDATTHLPTRMPPWFVEAVARAEQAA
ncbi:MAG: acyl-CoA thioesterase [Thermoleophilia bacterium]|nr:acyl-CoA thioesterase [Thermoleophilia bacterium]